eukprot:TRINITY_DN76351_c0_g1_i1.p1 TRINITY_DN76351_c0_g1~~TRINITY_DN76351_c0_g1_i1.p1  ORF type:complete len:587 (-),score=136.02 TRINITY_DN76351_c0_g1_i1:361-2121(-)
MLPATARLKTPSCVTSSPVAGVRQAVPCVSQGPAAPTQASMLQIASMATVVGATVAASSSAVARRRASLQQALAKVGKSRPAASFKILARCSGSSAEAAAPAATMAASLAADLPQGQRRWRISEIVGADDQGKSFVGSEVVICGWVRTLRAQKSIAFLKVNDGSHFDELQVVLEDSAAGFEDLKAEGTGASVRVFGKVVESPAKGQAVEISCVGPEHGVKVVGTVDSKSYPLAKKRHSIEYLRSIAHLRPRSNLIGAVSRSRNAIAMYTHGYFQERGFLYVNTPIITTADCEGAGEMFRVSVDSPTPAAAPSKETEEFFGRPAYLTVSGQLDVENFCCALGDVYTFGPTFRAEKSGTTRHLAEFWMLEPELAFADVDDAISCAEGYFKYVAEKLLANNKADLDFFKARADEGVIDRLEVLAKGNLKRITYTDAIDELTKAQTDGKVKFEYPPTWGEDLQTEHERYLAETIYQAPVVIKNYPIGIKPFYMRVNEDGKTVANFDIIAPGPAGEVVGGSQREERLDVLDNRLKELGLEPEDYQTYRELRQYGSVPHAGFGVGFERMVMLCTGVGNVRDVIPFPRYPGHA